MLMIMMLADLLITKIEQSPAIALPSPADNPWNHSKMNIGNEHLKLTHPGAK